jgi:hypothetical protein
MRLTTLLLAALLSIGIIGSTATYAGPTPSGGAHVQLIKKGKKHKKHKHKHKRNHKKTAANT